MVGRIWGLIPDSTSILGALNIPYFIGVKKGISHLGGGKKTARGPWTVLINRERESGG